jgi:density-regulated protein
LEKNLPSEFSKLEVKDTEVKEGATAGGEEEEKKRQKRGGKGIIKANKKKDEDDKDKKIGVSRAPRGKKKSVTVIHGLSSFGKSFRNPCRVRCLTSPLQVST